MSYLFISYNILYNNQINAHALIGQSAVGYCYYKPTEKSRVFWIIELFFCKKIPLSRHVEYVMDGSMDQSVSETVSESVSQWVRDVCMSHQSDRIYFKQPIKFRVLKVNGMWEDSIPIQFRTAIFISSTMKEEKVFISSFSVGYAEDFSYGRDEP